MNADAVSVYYIDLARGDRFGAAVAQGHLTVGDREGERKDGGLDHANDHGQNLRFRPRSSIRVVGLVR